MEEDEEGVSKSTLTLSCKSSPLNPESLLRREQESFDKNTSQSSQEKGYMVRTYELVETSPLFTSL
jgi:hypothetical protein